MKVGVLFSGGKDSTYALSKAMKDHSVCCLISVFSKNKDSYMFHTPNINLVEVQAELIGLPILIKKSEGVKEKELEDLKEIILEAKEKFKIEGIVTGAVASNYQADRIKKICSDLGLECINPLWGLDQEDLMKSIVKDGFEFIIISVACDGLSSDWLGKVIDLEDIGKLVNLSSKTGFNVAGEGGEFETLMINGPIFKKKLVVEKAEKIMENEYTGWYKINSVKV